MKDGKAIEVCLVEDEEGNKGEKQDLIVWEEAVKGWSEAQEWRAETDKKGKDTRASVVRTDGSGEAASKV